MNQDKPTFSTLLTELQNAQSGRDALMKWKLIVIAVLGSAGLGFMDSKTAFNFELIMAVIPLTCVYIDLLCRNFSVRTKRINHFIASLPDSESIDFQFAQFYQRIKKLSGQSLESYALIWSTVTVSVIIGIIGAIVVVDSNGFLVCSSILALLLTWVVEKRYQFEKKTLQLDSEARNKS
jgi:hypothetical protein